LRDDKGRVFGHIALNHGAVFALSDTDDTVLTGPVDNICAAGDGQRLFAVVGSQLCGTGVLLGLQFCNTGAEGCK